MFETTGVLGIVISVVLTVGKEDVEVLLLTSLLDGTTDPFELGWNRGGVVVSGPVVESLGLVVLINVEAVVIFLPFVPLSEITELVKPDLFDEGVTVGGVVVKPSEVVIKSPGLVVSINIGEVVILPPTVLLSEIVELVKLGKVNEGVTVEGTLVKLSKLVVLTVVEEVVIFLSTVLSSGNSELVKPIWVTEGVTVDGAVVKPSVLVVLINTEDDAVSLLLLLSGVVESVVVGETKEDPVIGSADVISAAVVVVETTKALVAFSLNVLLSGITDCSGPEWIREVVTDGGIARELVGPVVVSLNVLLDRSGPE